MSTQSTHGVGQVPTIAAEIQSLNKLNVAKMVSGSKEAVNKLGSDPSRQSVNEVFEKFQKQIGDIETARAKLKPTLEISEKADLPNQHYIIRQISRVLRRELIVKPSTQTRELNAEYVNMGDAVKLLTQLRDKEVVSRKERMEQLQTAIGKSEMRIAGNSQTLIVPKDQNVSPLIDGDLFIDSSRYSDLAAFKKALKSIVLENADQKINQVLNFASAEAFDILKNTVAERCSELGVIVKSTAFNEVKFKESEGNVEIHAKAKISFARESGLEPYVTVDVNMATTVTDGKVTTEYVVNNVVPNTAATLADLVRLQNVFAKKPAVVAGVVRV